MASNAEGRRLFRQLAKGQPPPAIALVYGEETFLVEEAIRAIGRAVLPDGGDDFSNQVFEASEVSGQTVRQALETMSLFGGRRFIHLRNIGAMSAGELEALEPYLARPAPDTYLLMSGRTVDARKRFFKMAKKSADTLFVQFKPLYRNELAGWVSRRARGKSLQGVGQDVAELIVAWTGPALAEMDSALDKLALYTADSGGRVDEVVVRAVLDDTRTRGVFELTRLLGGGDMAESLNALDRMIDQGEGAAGIISMIARHFRIVWRIREGREKRLGGGALAKHAGCPPMFMREYERDADHFDQRRLENVLMAVHDAETQLKSSSLADHLVLSSLVMSVCK